MRPHSSVVTIVSFAGLALALASDVLGDLDFVERQEDYERVVDKITRFAVGLQQSSV